MKSPIANSTVARGSIGRILRRRIVFAASAFLVAALTLGILGTSSDGARVSIANAESLHGSTTTAMSGTKQGNMAGMSNSPAATPATVPVSLTITSHAGATPMQPASELDATLLQVQEMMRILPQMIAQLESRAPDSGKAGSGAEIDLMMAQLESMMSRMQSMSNLMAGATDNSSGDNMPVVQPGAAPQMTPSGTMSGSAPMSGGAPMDEPVPDVGMQPATQTEGNQPLAFRLENGVKVFELTAQPVKWPISKVITVNAWSFNGTVPGPMIRVTLGDRVRILVTNRLPEATSIHWHGLPVPNAQDGVAQPPLTQNPIQPGQTFTYEFVARPSGTYMYHSHVDTDRQVNIGLFGAVIIDPKDEQVKPDKDVTLILNEWRYDAATGKTYPAMPGMGEPNYFTINGKTYPEIPELNVEQGERVRLRLINAGQFEHPMHLHGKSFKIVATDGNPVPEIAQLTKDTVAVHPGERYDIEFVADNPGQWAFHCHILHHVTNDDVEPGGLLMVINVR